LQIAENCLQIMSAPVENYLCATAANGLINCNGHLLYRGVKVQSVPVRSALVSFNEWLGCRITLHNLTFDGSRIFRAISKYSFIDEFAELTHGFTDMLHVFRKSYR
jgi:hypothetical protein